jgi:hypothetical protein
VLLSILALPIAYVAWLVVLVTRRRLTDVGVSVLVAVATFAIGAWEIQQSRASTAAIGFIFLPALAAVAGGLALLYTESRRAESRALRSLGLVALFACTVPAAVALRGGRQTIAKNGVRDADQARRDSAYAQYREQLDTLQVSSGDRYADTLVALLRRHRDDREYVLAGLERPQLPMALLDTFARSPDLGIALQAMRNPNASPATLERIYRTHNYRTYFLQALAGHANTPPAILREIHALRPAPITGLDISFAGNPSTPVDVLRDVARTSESIDAVRTLLHHPALDCAMIEGLARGPALRAHPGDADATERLASERAARCR